MGISLTEQPSIKTLAPITVGLVGLKLFGVIKWSWVWVLSPLWGPYGLTVIALGVAVLADHEAQND